MFFQDDPDVPAYSLPLYASQSLLTQRMLDGLAASFLKLAGYIPSLRESTQMIRDLPPPITSTPIRDHDKKRGKTKHLPADGEAVITSPRRQRQPSPTPNDMHATSPVLAPRRTQRERNAKQHVQTSGASGSNKRSKRSSQQMVADDDSPNEFPSIPRPKPAPKRGRPKGRK